MGNTIDRAGSPTWKPRAWSRSATLSTKNPAYLNHPSTPRSMTTASATSVRLRAVLVASGPRAVCTARPKAQLTTTVPSSRGTRRQSQ